MENKMEIKKELRPMNVRPIFKTFIKNKKIDMEGATCDFISEYNVLMSYLNENERFVKDFSQYCTNKKTTAEDLLKILTK